MPAHHPAGQRREFCTSLCLYGVSLFLRDEPTFLRETCRPSRNNEGFARVREVQEVWL